jgi:hypothetical protein
MQPTEVRAPCESGRLLVNLERINGPIGIFEGRWIVLDKIFTLRSFWGAGTVRTPHSICPRATERRIKDLLFGKIR